MIQKTSKEFFPLGKLWTLCLGATLPFQSHTHFQTHQPCTNLVQTLVTPSNINLKLNPQTLTMSRPTNIKHVFFLRLTTYSFVVSDRSLDPTNQCAIMLTFLFWSLLCWTFQKKTHKYKFLYKVINCQRANQVKTFANICDNTRPAKRKHV